MAGLKRYKINKLPSIQREDLLFLTNHSKPGTELRIKIL